MLNKQKQVEESYFQKKRAYEEQEAELLQQRKKGIRDLEEIGESAHYYLNDFAPDMELINEGLRQLDYLKEEVFESAKMQQKQLQQKMDDLEEAYFKEIRSLSEQESQKTKGEEQW